MRSSTLTVVGSLLFDKASSPCQATATRLLGGSVGAVV
jgi:hypothetical protein